MTERPTVLIVEDRRAVAEMYSRWLAEAYHVRTAYDGSEAMALLDDDVDVVLLDRMMPDIGGDHVLTAIRSSGLNCRVALVTAVEPDFDVLELGFDDYLVKPVMKRDLYHAVETLLTQQALPVELREYYALRAKRTSLELEKPSVELERSSGYRELRHHLVDLESMVDGAFREPDPSTGVGTVFRRVAQRMALDRDDG